MTALIKLKQIENGAGVANAVAVAHGAATLTNNAAPFTFDVPTQVGNIPQVGTVSVSGNTLTFTPGDGTPPVTYTPTIAADVFLQSGVYNSGSGHLELTLTDASVVTIPLSDLVPVVTVSSQTIYFTGNGAATDPITGQVTFSTAPGNLAFNDGAGVVALLTVTSGDGINLIGEGSNGFPLNASIAISTAPGNIATVSPTGLYVPAPALQVPPTTGTTETITAVGDGSVATPFKFHVKLQPDNGTTVNFVHAASGAEQDDNSQLGLGYTQGVVHIGTGLGAGPFDLTAQVSQFTVGWNGTPELVRVDGYINGVYYAALDGWDYTTLTAVTWAGLAGGSLFDLEATDEVRFVLHIRAA